jgi:hypothetical protein
LPSFYLNNKILTWVLSIQLSSTLFMQSAVFCLKLKNLKVIRNEESWHIFNIIFK